MLPYLICSFLVKVVGRRAPTYLENVECAPYVHYVETDSLHHYRYNPFYVNLYRCYGTDTLDPRNRQCLPTKTGSTEIDIYVHNIGKQEWETIRVQNHTQCEERCVLEESMCTPYQTFDKEDCTCICNYETIPSRNMCRTNFYWDKTVCNCICSIDSKPCNNGKYFSGEECGCVCDKKAYVRCANLNMMIDNETCQCVETSISTEKSTGKRCEWTSNIWILIIALVVEFVVMVLLYCICYRFCYKRLCASMKAERKVENINKETFVSEYFEDSTRSTIAKTNTESDFEEEVPPFRLYDIKDNCRATFDRGLKNYQGREGLRTHSLPRGKTTSPFIKPGLSMMDNDIYSQDMGSQKNQRPYLNGSYYSNTLPLVCNEGEPIIRDYEYDSEMSWRKESKNVSLV